MQTEGRIFALVQFSRFLFVVCEACEGNLHHTITNTLKCQKLAHPFQRYRNSFKVWRRSLGVVCEPTALLVALEEFQNQAAVTGARSANFQELCRAIYFTFIFPFLNWKDGAVLALVSRLVYRLHKLIYSKGFKKYTSSSVSVFL